MKAYHLPFCLILLLGSMCLIDSCSPKEASYTTTYLGQQKIVIYESYQAKYSQVKFYYPIPLPNGHTLRIYGDNGGTGYYYQKYPFHKGDTITVPVSIVYNGEKIEIGIVDFEAFKIN